MVTEYHPGIRQKCFWGCAKGPGSMRIVSHEEEEAYLDAANPLLRDLAVLILETGMRP